MLGIWIDTSSLVISRPVSQVAAVGLSLAAGAIYGVTTAPAIGDATAVLLLALGLATPLAVAKTSTACGLNVLADLAPSTRPSMERKVDAFVYLLATVLTAATLGLVLGWVGSLVNGFAWIWALGPLVAVLGLLELGVLGRRGLLTLHWQVPAEWVSRKRHASALWGVLLGTGLTTYMPYPTYFGVILLGFCLPMPLGVILMAVYGFSRAMPTLVASLQSDDRWLAALHAHAWDLRAVGHATAACTAIALSGTIMTGWWMP